MQKPLALCEEIVTRLSLRAELVVDPFFGSGALLKAATRLGRRIAGCEKNPNLAELAIANVSEEYGGEVVVQDDNDFAEEETDAE
jgi:DNA modification methylase